MPRRPLAVSRAALDGPGRVGSPHASLVRWPCSSAIEDALDAGVLCVRGRSLRNGESRGHGRLGRGDLGAARALIRSSHPPSTVGCMTIGTDRICSCSSSPCPYRATLRLIQNHPSWSFSSTFVAVTF